MTKLKPYTKYKDSGVDWLGDIPMGWEIEKLKYYYAFEKGAKAALYTNEYIGSKKGEYPVYSGKTSGGGVMGTIDTYDYDFNKDLAILITTVGAKAMTHKMVSGRFSLSQNIAMLKNRSNHSSNLDSKYVYYFLFPLLSNKRNEISLIMQPSLRFEDLSKYEIVKPSLNEQRQISVYLDNKADDISKYIKKLIKEIELLKEHRQRIIHKAITRGVNKSSRDNNLSQYKETNITWANRIPKDWNIKRLKYVFRVRKDIAGKLGYRVLAITQSGIKVKDIESNLGQLSSDYSKYQFVRKGDFAMNHMDLLTGYVDISKYEGVTSPDYRVFELIDRQCDPQYFLYILQTCYHEKIFYPLGRGASKIGRWRLGIDAFNNFLLPIPNLKEQITIATFLDSKLMEIDKQINEINNQIKLIKEYKQSLISKVVTGKVDVRNINNNLSED
ncbi:restriction endonuclease subunit S [Candidatus Dojkabacteria bacterium]|nr:restriction endonuclease subunit S [Candidatus Dojkabacteria bacterium]